VLTTRLHRRLLAVYNSAQMSAERIRVASAAAFLALLCSSFGVGQGSAQTVWVGSWAASQQLAETRNSLGAEDLRDTTLRQIVHLSIGGAELRVRLSNRFGTVPLRFTSVHLAYSVPAEPGRIAVASDKVLSFSGSPDVTLPAGADYVSDPLAFPLPAQADLAITLHADTLPSEQTGHPGSRATSWLSHGDWVSATELPNAKKVEHWYFIAGVDVAAPRGAASIVALGDSITDGHGATTDGNDRWTDALTKRMQGGGADLRNLGVLNHGIGGNRLLLDGLGPNALARFDHDVLAQAGVRYLMVLEGINDIGTLTRDADVPDEEHTALVYRMLAAYGQIITRAHTHDIKVIGATILPFVGSEYYHPGPKSEQDRQVVNQWIRAPGHFDAVVDFDKTTRDPEHPDRLLPAFDSGDHLHPSPSGYRAMAEAVPLSLFSTAAPEIAITFDDLPAHGALPPGETRVGVAAKILKALGDAGLPPTYGFVNGLRLNEQPSDAAVLQAWRSAGNLLGNHGWSHMNLNQSSLEDAERDVMRNEPVLARWAGDEDWHWFRYPFLAEGETDAKRTQFRAFLAQHDYRVAAVTMTFGDYLWNEPYARCKAKGDAAAITRLESSYLAAADQSADYYRALSHSLYQRDIPYVLLMHVGAFDAEMLPKLLSLYRAKGFEFVTLEQAEHDEFYRESTNLRLAPGAQMLEAAMRERHLPLPAHNGPGIQLDSLCR